MSRSLLPRLALSAALLTPAMAGAQALRTVPELIASADSAWTAGKFDAAFARYAKVLEQDSTAGRALFRVATLLAWRNDLDRSIALFRDYLKLSPADDDGRVALARVLAWRGRYAESLALTDSVRAAHPRQREAALLAAQVLAWGGRLEEAIAQYEHWLSVHTDDTDAWVGLAQAWRWAGRPEESRRAVEHALNIDPRSEPARAQLEWANAALAPSVEPTVINTNDSDDNRSTLYIVRSGMATPWGARVAADASYRVADLDARHGTSASFRASSSWSPVDGRLTLRGELGATRLDASDGPAATSVTHLEPLLAVRLSGRPSSALTLGAGVTHAAFDETASLILAGITATGIGADADLALRPRWSLGGGGEWTRLTGGTGPNARTAGSATVRWSFARVASLAATLRGFTYQHAAFDGYFAPRRYLLAEISSRVRLGGDLGWGLDSELGLGNQTITAFDNSSAGRFAQRVSAGIAYRLAEGVEWGVSGGFANVASPTTISSADYRAYSVALRGRFRL